MLLANNRRPTRLLLADTIAVARDTALGDRLRFGLTSLGMLIGTASLMLVTTFSLAGKDYVLHEIRSLGSNWISAEHPVVGGRSNAWSDNLTLEDMEAVRRNVSGIVAGSARAPAPGATRRTGWREGPDGAGHGCVRGLPISP